MVCLFDDKKKTRKSGLFAEEKNMGMFLPFISQSIEKCRILI